MTLGPWAKVPLILAAACFLFGAGATVLDVVLRAVAHRNLPGVIETTTLSIGLRALLSMPVCYLNGTHTAARLLSELRPNLFHQPLSIAGAIFALVLAAVMAALIGDFAADKLGGPETTSDFQIRMDVLLAVTAFTFLAALVAAAVRVYRIVRGAGSQ